MVKASRSGSQKSGAQETPQKDTGALAQPTSSSASTSTSTSTGGKKGKSSKNRRPPIGGTAVAGAKSMQPKELSTSSPADQQAEYYNRDTRRRMQHMGTGPYSEHAPVGPRTNRLKRMAKQAERQDRIKHLVNAKGPSRDIKLGRRNTYFLIGIIAFIIVLIAAFILIRHPF